MNRSRTRWIVAGALAVALVTGISGMALAQGMFGTSPFGSSNNGYGGMMGGGYGGGNGGMMGGGYGGMMGGNGLQGTPAVDVTSVAMTNQDTFSPAIIQVPAGTTVTWTNTDTDAHTVTFMPMMFNSGNNNVAPGSTFSRTFTASGVYYYRCLYHPAMVGEVIVTG
jgi:plastocyanin